MNIQWTDGYSSCSIQRKCEWKSEGKKPHEPKIKRHDQIVAGKVGLKLRDERI